MVCRSGGNSRKQVAIQVDQDKKSIWTTDDTVEDVLAEAGIEVTEHDVVSPGLQEQLGEDNSITVQKAFEVTLE